jgi:penicillin-binding protein 1A
MVFLFFFSSAVGGWLWFRAAVLAELPDDLSQYQNFRPQTGVMVKDRYGQTMDTFYVERRFWVPLGDLPQHVPDAFIAAEDRRFWEHEGVDLLGVARAIVVNLQEGGVEQGASTLTQQLVKNLIVGKERSYERKVKEAVLAWRLENELGKRRVLELYLNYVALGAGNYGVEAAARDYFGISARDLDPGQAALLAGLVPAPSRYSPRRDPDTARERRRLVLRAMAQEGMIYEGDVAAYRDDPVSVPRVAARSDRPEVAYVTEVRREIRRVLGDDAPYDLGLVVTSAMDPEIQRVAVRAVQAALLAHRQRQGPRVPIRSLDERAQRGFVAAGAGLNRDDAGSLTPPPPGTCLDVLVGRGGIHDLQLGPWRGRLHPEDREVRVGFDDPDLPKVPLYRRVRAGDVIPVCVDGEVARLSPEPWAEGAAVVLDHRTGEVLALVGGYAAGLEGFVRATQARRQPGSSFKPFVYAAALGQGRSQADVVVDAPLALPGGNGQVWAPKNYGGGYAGPVPLRTAMARSLNTVAVRLALEVGPADMVATAQRAGVRSALRADLTLALGSSEVTPMDLALGYATFARGGTAVDPVFLRELRGPDGTVLGQQGDILDLGGPVYLPGRSRRALEPGVAYEVADMLREVVRAGTARRAYQATKDRAGKTGTTNGFVDAWFVGFTPRYAVAVWIGTDGTGTLGSEETGGKAALPAWLDIVAALPEPDGEVRPPPPEVMLVPGPSGPMAVGRGRIPPGTLGPGRAAW